MKASLRHMHVELKVKEEISKRSETYAKKCRQELKILLAICRVPRMSHMFQQACRKKHDKKTFEMLEKRAQNQILEFKGDVPEEEFFEKFTKSVGTLPNNPQG